MALALVLAHNAVMHFINLSSNLIADDGLEAISRALAGNQASALWDLQVAGIDGRDTCWNALREMMRGNRNLLRLDVSNNPINHPFCGCQPLRFRIAGGAGATHLPQASSPARSDDRCSLSQCRLRSSFLLEWLCLEDSQMAPPDALDGEGKENDLASFPFSVELLCGMDDQGCDQPKGLENICHIIEENISLVWLVMANVGINAPSLLPSSSEMDGDQQRGEKRRDEEDERNDEEGTFKMDEDMHAAKTEELATTGRRSMGGLSFMCSLASSLLVNCTLTSLDLSWNQLDATTIAPIADVLDNQRHNNAALSLLSSLILRGNQLRDEGAQVLTRSLLNNYTITNLNLDLNFIMDEVCCSAPSCHCLLC